MIKNYTDAEEVEEGVFEQLMQMTRKEIHS